MVNTRFYSNSNPHSLLKALPLHSQGAQILRLNTAIKWEQIEHKAREEKMQNSLNYEWKASRRKTVW